MGRVCLFIHIIYFPADPEKTPTNSILDLTKNVIFIPIPDKELKDIFCISVMGTSHAYVEFIHSQLAMWISRKMNNRTKKVMVFEMWNFVHLKVGRIVL